MPQLHLPKQAVTEVDLPAVCFVTGETDEVEYHRTPFQYVPFWARLTIPLCGLFGILFVFLSMKRVQVDVPMTAQAHRSWIGAKRTIAILALSSVAVLLVSLVLGTELLLVGLGIFVVALVGVIVYSIVVLRKLGPVCKRIDDDTIVLEIPSEEALEAVSRRLGLGGRATAEASSATTEDTEQDELGRRLQSELDRL